MKIKVGYADYAVIPLDPEEAAELNCEAFCNNSEQFIGLRSDRPPQAQASALIHELLHACFYVTQVPEEGLTEEDVCRKLEAPLAAIIRDNPRLPGVLQKALRGEKPIVK